MIAAHAFLLIGIVLWSRERSEVLPTSTAVVVSFIRSREVLDKVQMPEIALVIPQIDAAISRVSFDDADAESVGGITAPASAPRIDSAVAVDVRSCAVRAGLKAGDAVTVLLAIEVLADGSAGDIEIATGSGNTTIDQATIDCARRFKWIPGTVDRHARGMRVNFPVTLVIPE